MSVFRYKAINTTSGALQRGELAGDTAADVRASLRCIGLRVLEVRKSRRRLRSETAIGNTAPGVTTLLLRILTALRGRFHRHMRVRRREIRAELFDGMATLLESGLPLMDAVTALMNSSGSSRSKSKATGSMLTQLRESLRRGDPLSQAMREEPAWFDSIEIALVETAEEAGTLPGVLRRLSERHAFSSELGHKVAAALLYPVIVMIVGIGVVIFLSTNTLPELVSVLDDADIAVPTLTSTVMSIGQFLAAWWLFLLIILPLSVVFVISATTLLQRTRHSISLRVRPPAFIQRMLLGAFALRLAELVEHGITLVHAVRLITPTLNSASLRHDLQQLASALERGQDLQSATKDSRWFNDEFRQLLAIGEISGELPTLLRRIGERALRQATRRLDRLTTILEPAVILLLATLIGLVVMAAILPLTRLQELIS